MLFKYTKPRQLPLQQWMRWLPGFSYSLFLFPVLFRRQVGEFFEDAIKIFLVVVPDQPRNRRSPPVSRLHQRFCGFNPQAVQVIHVFHPVFFFEQGRQIVTVDVEHIRQEIQRDQIGIVTVQIFLDVDDDILGRIQVLL